MSQILAQLLQLLSQGASTFSQTAGPYWDAVRTFALQTLLGRTIVGFLLMFTVPFITPVLFVKLIGFEGLRHLFSYEPRQSMIHGLDPRLKVVYPTIVSTLGIALNWQFVYALVGATAIPWLFLRPSPNRVRVILTMMGVPVIGMVWSQGLFHTTATSFSHLIFVFPPTLSWIGTPGLSTDGLLYGLQQAGRTLVAVSAALLLLFTTTPSEMVWAFSKFRLPSAAGLAFTAALRFLPQMLERMTVLLQVVQVRGYDLTLPRWWQFWRVPGYLWRVFVVIPVITVPLLIGSLRTTSVMAMVVDARAFGSQRSNRHMLKEHHVTWRDIVAWLFLLALAITVFLLTILHIGARDL